MNLKFLLAKYREIPVRVKASLWFFICSVFQKLISVISTAVFTRVMTTGDYGLISIYNSWTDILLMIASLSLNVGCFNVGMTRYDTRRESWVSTLQILSLISASVVTVIFIATFNIWGDWVGLSFLICCVMAVTFYFNPAVNLWTAKQRYTSSYRKLGTMTLAFSVCTLLLSLVMVLNSDHKGEAKIIASAAVTVIFGAVLLVCNLRAVEEDKFFDASFGKFAFKYNLQMMPAFISTSFMSQIDRIMIDRMISRDAAAIYSVAYNVAFMISIVSGAINATYNPWLMQKVKNKNFDRVNEIGIAISVALLFVIEGFIFLAPEVVKILAPIEYYEAIYIIPAVAGSTFFTLIYGMYSPVPQYKLHVASLASINVLAGIVNVTLNYIAIAKWGYIAAGYTTFISYFIYGFGTAIFSIYLLKKDGIKEKIYNGKLLTLMVLGLVISIIVVPLLYNFFIVRYLLLSIILIVFFLKRQTIINLIKMLKE